MSDLLPLIKSIMIKHTGRKKKTDFNSDGRLTTVTESLLTKLSDDFTRKKK